MWTMRTRTVLFFVVAMGLATQALGTVSHARPEADVMESLYAFKVKTIDGETRSLADFKGKTLLIVNTASRCGYTPQYRSLEALYQKYKDRGFVVLAFPANNFMGQEPGTDAQIKEFCTLTYGVTFPVFSKISVKGADQDPLYRFLTESSGFPGPIKWNFNKFLIDQAGRVVARYDSSVGPLDPDLLVAVERLLTA